MITDNLKNAHIYEKINDSFKLAFDFLRRDDLCTLAPGRYEIDGDKIYASIAEYDTKPVALGKMETHHVYLAVQCVLDGEELIGYAFEEKLTPESAYNSEKDKQFFIGEKSMIKLSKGDFMIVFPQDAHMAKIAVNENIAKVRKCNVKIHV